MLLAAPFASQDVWVYAAQGKVVASGLGATGLSAGAVAGIVIAVVVVLGLLGLLWRCRLEMPTLSFAGQ